MKHNVDISILFGEMINLALVFKKVFAQDTVAVIFFF